MTGRARCRHSSAGKTSSIPAKSDAVATRTTCSRTARFHAINQKLNADKKMTSTSHANARAAMTIIVNAIRLRTFRASESHLPLIKCEIAIAKASKAAPEKSDSPEAKYSAMGFIAEIGSAGHPPDSYL